MRSLQATLTFSDSAGIGNIDWA